MKRLVLFPFGGNAREAITTIERVNARSQAWEILGFLDDDPQKAGIRYGPYPVLGGREKLAGFPDSFVLAVPGNSENYRRRAEIIASLDVPAERQASIVDPSAITGPEVVIGKNTLIMANVVLTSRVRIGDSVVILPNTVVSHDATVGDCTMIGSNVSISGSVSIGTSCYIGSGSKIKQEISIGDGSLIGLGSVVIRPVDPQVVVAGNPARLLRAGP